MANENRGLYNISQMLTYPVSDLDVTELQDIFNEVKNELDKRFVERRLDCTHPKEYEGLVAVPRPPNTAYGCTYCLMPTRPLSGTLPPKIDSK